MRARVSCLFYSRLTLHCVAEVERRLNLYFPRCRETSPRSLARGEIQPVLVMQNHQHTRCCAHCGQRFVINPRIGTRHRYCSRPECVRTSRTVSRQKWLLKNGGKSYFQKTISVERVRNWRAKHPHYWKKSAGRISVKKSDLAVSRTLARALRCVALQDPIDSDLALKIGIIPLQK